MGYYLRHVLAVLVLPVSVVVVVPAWIWLRRSTAAALPDGMAGWTLLAFGVAVLLVGGVLFVASLREFAVKGRGTLGPWDPPRKLVIDGPYAYVRNPMISGVILLLAGEALVLRSAPHVWWAAAFALLNAVYIPLLEEPGLRRRFGARYVEYCRQVPRLVPRLTPWGSRPVGVGRSLGRVFTVLGRVFTVLGRARSSADVEDPRSDR